MRRHSNFRVIGSHHNLQKPLYVCPSCRRTASQLSLVTQSPLRESATVKPGFFSRKPSLNHSYSLRRKLHHGPSQPALEESLDHGAEPHDTAILTRRKGQHGFYWGRPKRKIREELKAWSIEDQKAREAISAQEAYTVAQQHPVIPSAYTSGINEEEDYEALDLEDQLGDEDVGYDIDGEGLQGTVEVKLTQGDVLRVRLQQGRTQYAIYLGQRETQHQFLLQDGRWAMFKISFPNTVTLAGFASHAEVQLLRDCLPGETIFKRDEITTNIQAMSQIGEMPAEIGGPFIQRLNELQDETLAFRRLHLKTLDKIHTRLADRLHYRTVTMREVTQELFSKDPSELSMGAQFAIYQALRKDEGRHQVQRLLHGAIVVIVTPLNLWDQFAKVIEWAREYQDTAAKSAVGHSISGALESNPLNKFINKARRLILKSRKIRSPTTIGTLGPSNSRKPDEETVIVTETGEQFTEDDLAVVEFMWHTFLKLPRPIGQGRFESIGSLILRAIGAYPTMRLDARIGRLFLQEIGSRAPWSEETDEDVLIPIPGRRGAQIADQLRDETEKLSEELGFASKPAEIPLPDTMAHLRKDWGDVEVICIDKPSSVVIDDGLSLEKSTEIPGAYWVHSHIAHPSAYMAQDHSLARRAHHFTSSVYTSRLTYHMLPMDIAATLSLRPNCSALTVSTLIMQDGEVKDVRVCASHLRKITKIDPAAVDKVFGRTADLHKIVLQVGHTKHGTEKKSSPTDLEPRHIELLTTLDKLCTARTKKRRQEIPEYPTWQAINNELSAWSSFSEPFDATRHTRSYHYTGDPTIVITCPETYESKPFHEYVDGYNLVTKAMILTSESIGRWFKERRVPGVFNVSVCQPDFPVSRLNRAGDDEVISAPVTSFASTPQPHVMLNVAQYARMTSPLRRFNDIVNEWQIDAYLKAEAAGSLKQGIDPTPYLPYSVDLLDEMIVERGHLVHNMEKLMRRSANHFTLQALFRAFHFKQAPLPKIFSFQVGRLVAKSVVAEDTLIRGYLAPFSLQTKLLQSKEGWEKGVSRKQWLPVKIELVDTNERCVHARAVGPPSNKAPARYSNQMRIDSLGDRQELV